MTLAIVQLLTGYMAVTGILIMVVVTMVVILTTLTGPIGPTFPIALTGRIDPALSQFPDLRQAWPVPPACEWVDLPECLEGGAASK